MPHPPIEPYVAGLLTVDDGAELYWECSGNPEGRPLVWLHGGPGSGLGGGGYRRRPDPAVWRIIGLDQRACGRSRPLVTEPGFDLDGLTTQRMVADLEAVREHLGVASWLVSGGSWGTTLALAYAEAHPDRVTGLALVAVTTGSRRELDWISRGMGRVFPEAWSALDAASGRAPGQPLLEAYLYRLTHPDAEVRLTAARAWCAWEDTHVRVGVVAAGEQASPGLVDLADEEQLGFALHVVHSWAHDCWLGERGVLDGLARITHLPAVLVHGRLDVSGPVETPWELHRRWPASRLVVVEDEGHGGPRMSAELEAAYAWFATRAPSDDASPGSRPRSG
ncbi:proline iminopeptidase [Nocardioides scoriae]|uniref:Proline iminopeptidase n=1 Tax=Nocardioides scoriae TaxID=642780 RepID=A0A1H1USW2_9ACTN|nr:alpha/beta fold hydrolase [Nocardioides scoriae]SDS75678.1 proline iminopeptidase [Nocardioides scoriae]